MYRGFWLREVPSVVFYVVRRFCGGTMSNGPLNLGGSAKEDPHVRGRGEGEGGRGELGAELV